MRYLLIPIGSCLLSLVGFSQNDPTVTLIFASSANNTYKNFEAVIDGVSYYSENIPVQKNKKSTGSVAAVDRNIIWLNNFQPGKHTIEVYNLKNGTHSRGVSSPVYASPFMVKKGFDTKIAVTNNGQVQFSERANVDDIPSDISENNSNKSNHRNGGKKIATNANKESGHKNVYRANSTKAIDQKNEDSYNKENTDVTERHSRKRIDTAIIMGSGVNNKRHVVHDKNKTSESSDKVIVADALHQIDDNGRVPMNDEHFNEFYVKLQNQWHPGQRMKTLTGEFSNGGNNFTTSQAKQLLKLLTEEGNRLKLAKLAYQHITDPENFNEMDEILHFKASRKELDNFVEEEKK
ncbi:MAG TPA: DUF4476 domain-containing protein [Ginsengibacter sp.]|nr:DUF4476 domain-containing protein [Ginsengibacter sp.]